MVFGKKKKQDERDNKESELFQFMAACWLLYVLEINIDRFMALCQNAEQEFGKEFGVAEACQHIENQCSIDAQTIKDIFTLLLSKLDVTQSLLFLARGLKIENGLFKVIESD